MFKGRFKLILCLAAVASVLCYIYSGRLHYYSAFASKNTIQKMSTSTERIATSDELQKHSTQTFGTFDKEGHERYFESLYSVHRGTLFANSVFSRTNSKMRKPIKLLQKHWVFLSDKGKDFFENRPTHELSTVEPYKSRKEQMTKLCNKRMGNIDLSRMVYDDKHKLVFCVVPKAACTTWKRILWFLLGKEGNATKLDEINSRFLVLNNGYLPTLDKLGKAEAMRRLATYTTAFVMRDPIQRLVSAFTSKFTNRTVINYKIRLGRWIASRQSALYLHGIPYHKRNITAVLTHPLFKNLSFAEKEQVVEYLKVLRTGAISFQQFARYILTLKHLGTPDYAWDVHWRSQLGLCNPCAVNYDYVIKFEDLAEDSNRLLRYLQSSVPKEEQVQVEFRTPSIDKTASRRYLDQITPAELKELYRVYGRDKTVLGYN